MTSSFLKTKKLKPNSLLTSLVQAFNRLEQIRNADADTFLTKQDADKCYKQYSFYTQLETTCLGEKASQSKSEKLSNSKKQLLNTLLAIDDEYNQSINTLQRDLNDLAKQNKRLSNTNEKQLKELDELDSKSSQNYNSVVTERDNLKVENAELNATNKTLENEKVSLVATKQKLENEKDELRASLAEAQDCGSKSDGEVFPFVTWGKTNPSNAWYKDVDWSVIPFNSLSDDEKEKLDWSKINYKEASTNHSFDASLIDWSDISAAKESLQVKAYEAVNWDSFNLLSFSEEEKQHINSTKVDYAKICTQLKAQDNVDFNIDSLDWSFINNLDPYFKKKLYKKVAWDKVDFKEVESSAFDWSSVNIKKAMKSDQFTLNAIDIEETKESKAFKKLKRALKKSSADDLLVGASDETLVAIGYQNLVGKIGDSLINNFTTASHNYSMILKPLSYVRAAAVATAMGGSLAPQATGESYDFELVDEIQSLASNEQIASQLSNSKADDRSLAWLEEKIGEDNQKIYSALDLQSFDQYSGNGESPLSRDNKLWFIVDLGSSEATAETSNSIDVF